MNQKIVTRAVNSANTASEAYRDADQALGSLFPRLYIPCILVFSRTYRVNPCWSIYVDGLATRDVDATEISNIVAKVTCGVLGTYQF